MGFLPALIPLFAGLGGAGATAGAVAGASAGLGTLATGLAAGGAVVSGVGGLAAGLKSASINRQNANLALESGQRESEAAKLKYGNLGAEQQAAYAANGIDVGSGSVRATMRGTVALGALDSAMIHYDAAQRAYGFREQARADTASGFGSLAKGIFAGTTSLISGAQSTGDKWARFKDQGVPGFGGDSMAEVPY